MRNDFGVGLRRESRPSFSELLFEFEIIFDNSVVHHDDIARSMRMSIGFRRPAVGRPTGVANSDRPKHRVAINGIFEILELAFTPANGNMAIAQDGDSRRVVAAVLQLAEAFQNQWCRFTLADVTYNAAHDRDPLIEVDREFKIYLELTF